MKPLKSHRRRRAIRPSLEALETRQLFSQDAPNILLTPQILSSLQQEATTNTPRWQAFENDLNAQLNQLIGPGSYEGDQLPLISDYALGYQVLKDLPGQQATADAYADKAIAIMKSGLNDYLRVPTETQEFLARGDGTTATFTLPNADFDPNTLNVYLAPVTTEPVVRGDTPFTQDVVDSFMRFLKVSNTPDGPANYVEGVDWQHNSALPNEDIDWSLNHNEPNPGQSYYVTLTSSTNSVGQNLGSDYTVSGQTITFAVPPSAGQALFVEYLYGTHATDFSTLAYQQTSSGDGGFNSIFADTGYTSRYLGKHIAMGLDWLWDYPGLNASLKSQATNLLIQWTNYLSTSGYYNDAPSSNYEAGTYDSRVMTALALANRDPSGPQLVSQMESYRDQFIKPLLTAPAPTGSEAGGFWAEGWNYGALATENVLLAAQALATAGDATETGGLGPAAEERHWASDVINTLISSQPTPSTVYDGGDGYAYPEPFPDDDLVTTLAATADDPTARGYANYILQDRPSGSTPNYLTLILGNPSAQAAFWSSAPLAHDAQGQGLVTARADWNYNSTWMAFQLGNLVQADHQTNAPGMLEVQRGGDALLINPQAWAEIQDPSIRGGYSNAVVLDDNGDGAQTYRFSTGSWYGTPGVFLTAYEATPGFVYAAGDYAAAYSAAGQDGNDGSATQLTRDVVYLRPDLIVVHDRAGTLKDSYPKQLRWHFQNAPAISGNGWVETVGSSKLFAQTFSDVPVATTSTEFNAPGTPPDQQVGYQPQQGPFYQVITQNASPTLKVQYTTALQTAPSSTTGMVATTSVHTADGRMEGVQMGNNLVLFGRTGTIDPSGSISYTTTGSGTINHLLVDLQAGKTYHILVNGVASDRVADAQGAISFLTGSATQASAASLVLAGLPTSTVAGTANRFTVTAEDSSGHVATGYTGTIHFTSTDGGAVMPADYTFTAADQGVHTFAVTLTQVGSQAIRARDTAHPTVTGLASGITVTPAAARVLTVDYAATTTAGVPRSLIVTARDAFGNIATGYTGTVHFTSSDGGAVLPTDDAFRSADQGRHSFSATLVQAGTQAIRARDTAHSTITGVSSGTQVTPSAARVLTVDFPTAATAGVSHSVIVTARDLYGNIATGYMGTVHFTSNDTHAALPADYTFIAADQGRHTFAAVLKTAGTQALRARDTVHPTITGLASNIAVTPAAANHIGVSGYPTTTSVGAEHSFLVKILDAFGNVATAYTGTVHFSSDDLLALLPADWAFTASDAGQRTFSATFKSRGVHTLKAADNANASIAGQESGISVS
jgi:hypothetical protein